MTQTAAQLVDHARSLWTQWLVAAAPEEAARLEADSGLVDELLRVWEASDYVAQSCLRDRALLPALVDTGDLRTPRAEGEMRARLVARLKGVADEAALMTALRRFRRHEMVRIIWRDLARLAPLAETLEELSALADACIDLVLERLYTWAVAAQGQPRDADGTPQRLVVLGMGKLGARELNLSSDIDLIFAFPTQGETDGRRHLSNEEFFSRLCRQLVKVINNTTVDGFVFRVDTRLRPFGDSGPLVQSFAGMEAYYESQAREWERYAIIKARVVAGDQEAGAQLMATLRPFVYRRYLDFGAIESLREMKQLISQELKRKGMADNVKLGPGGIREIEFIGQAFQLIRGGRDPDLQVRPILLVLERLCAKDLMPHFAVRQLTRAYEFLRLTENRVQAWRDEQTHLLPEDEAGRLRLARSMGFEGWEGFARELDRHRRRVQGQFDQVFATPHTEEEAHASPLLPVWEERADEETAVSLLEDAGFDEGAPVLELLRAFRATPAYRALGQKGQRRMDQLGPLLLEAVGATAEPLTTLDRVLKLLGAVARRTAYLALLVETPLALSQVVRLSAASPWISDLLALYPMLLDELLDPRRLYSPMQRAALDAEVQALLSAIPLEDLEQRMDRLRQFARSNMLRVAAADITGAIPLMKVSDYLTWIAEAVTAAVVEQAWGDLVAKHGVPTGIRGGGMGFGVIAYGKLGGWELGYGSDLDLVFLHANEDENAQTDGERPTPNAVFYARMGNRMIHVFTTRTGAGQLYEVDTRLRPNGASGMMVGSLAAFEAYQRDAAWTWEHQALLRARFIAGDPYVGERFVTIRRETLCRERDPDLLRTEVREMRERMRASLDKSGVGGFDLKQGPGGIADIEFMVQYLILREAYRHPDLVVWSDNIRQLEGLARDGVLPQTDADALADAYRAFRAAYHRSHLQQRPGLAPADAFADERGLVGGLWQRLMQA